MALWVILLILKATLIMIKKTEIAVESIKTILVELKEVHFIFLPNSYW